VSAERTAGSSRPVEPTSDSSDALLSVAGVSVTLGGREILSDVSFAVSAGELIGLIGSNGAGKTTLMRVILGLEAPGSGEVLLNGEPRPRRTSRIGYVPQKFELDGDMPLRARDVVALGIDGNRFGLSLPSRTRRERVSEMLGAVDAEGVADTRIGDLSGGEQQRIMIAHALIQQPELLLLDEPLANLDLRAAQEVVALLSDLARTQRIAVLVSAHDMNPLLPVMDRVVYLAGGHAAVGPTEAVVRADVLSALYGHHVDVLRIHGRVLVVAGPGGAGGVDVTLGHGEDGGALELHP
jgi:zinc/manganese transport system ATP-binding protein